jgi:coatomer protein complex subunit alpha (xenin)
MLTKFETRSGKIKALSFHPHRPWIVAALYSGTIQLWDYKLGTLVDSYDEHQGPVRALTFHPSQPIFASGGDDTKIKLVNFKHGTISTLQGHIDFLRTLQFHSELPWLVSCSDDQTIRIWNWQSRSCLSVLTGHAHYVMSAFFHPTEPLIVSASLDQTIRVWDFQNLKKKSSASGGPIPTPQREDVFGNMDVVVKYVLEGHSRGVNWAEFHPSLPLIVSCADDRLVKLWRYNESKAWEVDTCRGHYNNVSAVTFLAQQYGDCIVSVCEDKTIRVWDINKRTCLHTFRREHDKFWCLAQREGVLGAGHESGLVVFKLERQRAVMDGSLVSAYEFLYCKGKELVHYDAKSGKSKTLAPLKRGHVGVHTPRRVSWNPAEGMVLVQSGREELQVEVYFLNGGEPRKITATSACFVARNRFVTIEKSNLVLRDVQNNMIKEFVPTLKSGKSIKMVDVFLGTQKSILITTPSHVLLYDLESGSTVAEIAVSNVKYVYWNADRKYVALMSKHNLVICTAGLEQVCLVHETIKLKSGCWDGDVFVYTTLSHIKFSLVNGDTGIIKTLTQVLYLMKIGGSKIHAVDRKGQVEILGYDSTEYLFKHALSRDDIPTVNAIIRDSNLVGSSIIGYLQKKGYPHIALQFVKDPKTRFDLALECGELGEALVQAKVIDEATYWNKLKTEALWMGDTPTVEMCYQKLKDIDNLGMFYLCTGDSKLEKMKMVAKSRGNEMQYLLWTGDVKRQVEVLLEGGHDVWAWRLARTHGIEIPVEGKGKVRGQCVGSVAVHRGWCGWPLMKRTIKKVEEEVVEEWGEEEWGAEVAVEPSPAMEFEEPAWGETSPVLEEVVEEFVVPEHGPRKLDTWTQSTFVGDHIAAGSFDTAIELLEQRGIVALEPLKPYFMKLFESSRTFLEVAPLTTSTLYKKPSVYTVDGLVEKLQQVYPLMTAGRFAEAGAAFLDLLHESLFVPRTQEVPLIH